MVKKTARPVSSSDTSIILNKEVHKLSQDLKPLGDPVRLALLALLADGQEHCVCEMAELLKEPEFNISRKLAPLKKLGLICARRAGTWMYYHLCQKECSSFLQGLATLLRIPQSNFSVNRFNHANSDTSGGALADTSNLKPKGPSHNSIPILPLTTKARLACQPKSKSSCCVPETLAAVKWRKAGHAPSKAIKLKSGLPESKRTA